MIHFPPRYPLLTTPLTTLTMPSVFRSIFGGSNHNQPTTNSRSSSKSHSRSHSGSNIYATTPPSSRPTAQRSQSYSASRTAAPSPLRFATGTSDTRTAYGYGRRAPSYSTSTPSEPRPQVLRRASHNSREAGKEPFPFMSLVEVSMLKSSIGSHMYTSSHHTPASSRSNSNSSMFTGMGSVPVSSSHSEGGHHPKHPGVRPPLRSNHTWHPGSSAGSASSRT